MSSALLQTKLHVPAPRPGLLGRPRLTARMAASPAARLTLVSAPAGFGKTTLLSAWAALRPGSTAWVSLDEGDDDPASFWAYVVAALQTVVPQVGGASAPSLPETAHAPHAGLEHLLNALQATPHDVHLVLDDYHVVRSATVHDGMAFLLDHLPAHVHVVLSTRADPPLQLARRRARGQLVELRAADLRFSVDEAGRYLRDAVGLPLTEQDVAALDGRTEGWAAALQLAALSMQGRTDLPGFIAGFTGDDRYVVDYLAEEVLQRLPAQVRSFLLQTSVLDRFCGALCDAVTDGSGGRSALASLDRQNLFVVALDDQRRWYRYHHLFADVLRSRLLDEQPGVVPGLHLRASRWHEAQGDLTAAVHHALAGGHWPRAADLVERAVPELRRHRQEATFRGWFEALPADLVRSRPLLSISYVGSLMSIGELRGVEPHLQDVERWVAGDDGGAAADPRLRTVAGTAAMYRAAQALLLGDPAGTVGHARRALALAGADDHLEHGAAAALLGLAQWTTGDVDTAAEHYEEAVACMVRAGHVADLLGCTVALADLHLVRGRLTDAVAAHQRALDAARREPVVPRGTADVHTGLATLLLERGETDAAVAHLRAGAALGPAAALPQDAYRRRLATATVREAEGDLAGALQVLEEAERLYDTDFSPDVRPVAAVRARLQLRHARTSDAAVWVQVRGLTVDDALSYLREYEHLTLARTLLQQQSGPSGPRPETDAFLDRLLAAAVHGGRTATVTDVLLLQACSAHARHDPAAALALLQRALALAGPQGHVRAVLDHGPPVLELLRSLAGRAEPGPFVLRLLEAGGGPSVAVPVQPGPDRLSARELDVLRLLTSDLDGPAIARTLFVSLNTVRTHTKSIYSKLGVNSRRAAVHEGRRLGLLPRSSHA